jgi:hypothetical protein
MGGRLGKQRTYVVSGEGPAGRREAAAGQAGRRLSGASESPARGPEPGQGRQELLLLAGGPGAGEVPGGRRVRLQEDVRRNSGGGSEEDYSGAAGIWANTCELHTRRAFLLSTVNNS